MLEVKIPSEIRDYKGKLVGGLTGRQLVAIGGMLVVAVPFGVLTKGHLPNEIWATSIMVSVVPFAAFGFLKFKGMVFEEYAKRFYESKIYPQRRVYEDYDDNYFCKLREQLIAADVIEQRKKIGLFIEEDDDNEEYQDEDVED
jgi:hypothetical protein